MIKPPPTLPVHLQEQWIQATEEAYMAGNCPKKAGIQHPSGEPSPSAQLESRRKAAEKPQKSRRKAAEKPQKSRRKAAGYFTIKNPCINVLHGRNADYGASRFLRIRTCCQLRKFRK